MDHFVDIDASNGRNEKFTTLSSMLEMMREARASPQIEFHMVSLSDTAHPLSYFVRVVRDTANVDVNETRVIPYLHATRTC